MARAAREAFRLKRSTLLAAVRADYGRAEGINHYDEEGLARALYGRIRDAVASSAITGPENTEIQTYPVGDSLIICVREETITRAPACRRPCAIIRPIPREPPVTSAVLPAMSNRAATLVRELRGALVEERGDRLGHLHRRHRRTRRFRSRCADGVARPFDYRVARERTTTRRDSHPVGSVAVSGPTPWA